MNTNYTAMITKYTFIEIKYLSPQIRSKNQILI